MKEMKWFLVVCILFFCIACSDYHPKPRGYFRIELPEKSYKLFDEPGYPYSFEYADIATVVPLKSDKDSFWIDIVYPKLNATIYGSYKKINNNLRTISEDSRTFVYKHTVKAEDIPETRYENEDRRMYGILYQIKGNTASNVQFVLTDSIRHFFRGALYFNVTPNKDSLAPVEQYIQDDIIHLVETMQWK